MFNVFIYIWALLIFIQYHFETYDVATMDHNIFWVVVQFSINPNGYYGLSEIIIISDRPSCKYWFELIKLNRDLPGNEKSVKHSFIMKIQ